jgi:crotonobetainyl-CoA:carnitine CoA-transferase CaiB-like acyl-CoA transferase
VFEGVRILDVGTFVMVPTATVLFADLGADVIKVEHAPRGDPIRGIVMGGLDANAGSVHLMTEQANRGKRSVCLDLATPEAREVLYRLAETADVLITSLLASSRQALQIDVEHLRARNPDLIYVRADAVGPAGPEAGKPGFDAAVYWARAGLLNAVTVDGARPRQPRSGVGDRTASLAIAFGVASALFERERTGRATVVDTSLFAAAVWASSIDIVQSGVIGRDMSSVEMPVTNPLSNHYRTSDGRWIMLAMLRSEEWWTELCRHIGRLDLLDDPRFRDQAARAAHSADCAAELEATFAAAPLEEWRTRMATLRVPWEVVQNSCEVADDPQAAANGYIAEVEYPGGEKLRMVRTPVHFDGEPPPMGHAPEMGQHTEEILLELGYTWADIGALQDAGAIA